MKFSGRDSFYVKIFKPVIDYALALMLILPLLPVFLFVASMLAVSNKGKVFFRQARVGYKEKIFTALKFRTMNDAKDMDGNLLSDADRLTSVGKFIRKTSLDEIPQIVNVLRGDMSFIGPRPLLPEYLPYYNGQQRQRHEVRPGITGWAQVNGRNLTSWEKRFAMDVDYVDNVSFGLDLKIFFLTIIKVLRSEGISAEGHATMPKFSDYIKAKTIE